MPKFFTAQTGSLKVDRVNRRIYGVAIATVGDANGDLFDITTLQIINDLGTGGKPRARFDHPNRANAQEVEQTLENLLGEWINFRVDGEVTRADAQFAGVNTEKEDLILDLAEKAPHLFGVSIVIDAPKSKKGAACRPSAFFAADFVDLPSSNTAGLFAATTAAESPAMDPTDIYAKDGKFFCLAEGKEIPLKHTEESYALTKAEMKAAKAKETEGDDPDPETEAKKKAMERQNLPAVETTSLTSADVQKAATDAVAAERTRRKTFGTILTTAGVTDPKDVADLEEFYDQGLDEKQLKFLASRTIGARAKPIGEGSGTHESQNKKPPEGAEAELLKVETDAASRFDEEPSVRKSFGLHSSDRDGDEWKTARGRYVAMSRRRHQAEKK